MSLTSAPEIALAKPPLRHWHINVEGTLVFLVIGVVWQIASHFYPPYLFPSIPTVAKATFGIFADPQALMTIGLTYGRIIAALVASFVLALGLGISAAFQPRVERGLLPLTQLLQGVPSVCWVIFAVLWFKNSEVRIAFVILVSAFPSFYYQIREGIRAIPQELSGMVRALRPSKAQLVRKLMLPALVPQILTAWQYNLGAATKVTIMAELLGGISGIGYQLRLAQELFRMDRAIAWTLLLVAFVLLTNGVLARFDRHLLRWRVR